jgi:uncharacterized membrane protein
MTSQSEAQIAQDLRSKSFWISVVSAVLAIVVALGVPLTASQVHTLEDAAGIVIALILGLSGTAMVHAHNAAKLAVAEAQAKPAGPTDPAA